jgi:hypothetical protein
MRTLQNSSRQSVIHGSDDEGGDFIFFKKDGSKSGNPRFV